MSATEASGVSQTVPRVAAIAIGRNEGARLVCCLMSLKDQVERLIYVDSGSTDGSLETAQNLGVELVELDTSQPFTAARARNAGYACLQGGEAPTFIQFLDGDCEVQPGWIETATAYLEAHPDVAVVCGRRRERFPDTTIWNRMIDAEWDSPVGEAKACGGDAMMRAAAFEDVGGYNPQLIAGEEPELCVRLRQAGWRIFRLDAEMTLHDAAMTRLSQWWRRSRRAGYAYAQGAAMHGRTPERHKVTETRRAILWGLIIPLVAVGGAITFGAFMWALLALYPVQILRLIWRGRPLAQAVFLTLGKLPEGLGVAEYWIKRLMRHEVRLIEYK
ncbi:glycosyltransferase family 2 protein [Jannaschia sp. CCS1]|uniref:glycosyltransferase family 2 protein n=1 Tax=Jannaschia sp. (strain CCS1) TaxID=290400 RepID=UPI00006BFF5C|nr:glycosyltransferase [Jannaschia sp. CCS1]ABD57171.1 glycosyl transferase family 2 [Jannaschia sp. CCS1]